jgi:hypothetical protein
VPEESLLVILKVAARSSEIGSGALLAGGAPEATLHNQATSDRLQADTAKMLARRVAKAF